MSLNQVSTEISQAEKASGRAEGAVQLIAVSKVQPNERVLAVLNQGHRVFGENRVQEASKKFSAIETKLVYNKRMIGHLQTNKINKALRIFDTIDSVDSLRIAKQLANKLKHSTKPLSVLLEINTSGDKTKFGFDPNNDNDLLECMSLDEIVVEGLMTIGPASQEKESTIKAFALLRKIKDSLNQQIDKEKKLTVLSMGMSNDYELGIMQGSTMVRLGTALFGPREG